MGRLKSIQAAICAALPIFYCTPATAESEPRMIGNWAVGVADSGGPFMAASNDSGSYFGKWCDPDEEACFWMLVTKTPCKSGVQAPVLLNLNGAVSSPSITCLGEYVLDKEVVYRNIIHDPDVLNTGVVGSASISFAVAVEGGQFRVVRFTYSKSSEAYQRFTTLVAKMRPSNTKDKTL